MANAWIIAQNQLLVPSFSATVTTWTQNKKIHVKLTCKTKFNFFVLYNTRAWQPRSPSLNSLNKLYNFTTSAGHLYFHFSNRLFHRVAATFKVLLNSFFILTFYIKLFFINFQLMPPWMYSNKISHQLFHVHPQSDEEYDDVHKRRDDTHSQPQFRHK